MEEEDITDVPTAFRGICRACIKKNRELFPLFGGAKIKFGEKCFTISEILFLGGRVKTSPDDKLPKHVCRKCLTRLIEIFSFQLKCIETDIKLKNTLAKQNISLKADPNISFQSNKEIQQGKEFSLKTEKVDLPSSQVGFSEFELESQRPTSENCERDINDGTNNSNGNKSSISDIVVSILEDKDQQVSVSMTVTLNDKNQSRQQQDNRTVPELKGVQEKEDFTSANSCNNSNKFNDINESFLNNKIVPYNQDNEKIQGKFICTFCKNCFDTWSDLGKHIVKHKIQNNYGRLRSESPTFDILSEANLKEKLVSTEENQMQESFDAHIMQSLKNTSDDEDNKGNEIKLNVLCEQEMPILTPYPQNSVEERFYCSYCPANYKYKQDVRKHTRKKHKSELSKESYSCTICYKKFKQYLEVVRHRRRCRTKLSNDIIQQSQNNDLMQSDDNFSNNEEIEKINATTNTENEFTKKVNTSTDLNSKLNSEKSTSNNSRINGRSYCIFCPSHYARRSDYGTHLRIKHKTKLSDAENQQERVQKSEKTPSSVWKCRQCPVSFFDQKSLVAHYQDKHVRIQRKQNDVPKCKICSRIFINAKALDLHMLDKHRSSSKSGRKFDKQAEESVFECKICGDTFLTRLHWNSHNITKHRNSNKIANLFECQTCGKTFLRESSLKNHLKTHKNNCVNRKLSTSTDLESELTQNTSSSSSNRLSKSSDVENINQVHKCLICPSIFDNRTSLRRHSKMHHSDKVKEYDEQKTDNHLFQCLGCFKWFLANSYLKIHYKRHIVAKKGMKINCDICHKNFKNIRIYGQHLTSHRAAAQRSNRYCKECLTIFPNEKGYKIHMFNKHKKV